MRDFFRKLCGLFFNREFLSFCLFGTVNTFNTAWISTAADIIIPNRNAAAVIGYIGSLSLAYLIDSHFVFKKKPTGRSYVRFIISYVPNFIIYFLVTFITINTWHLPQFWATALATMIGGPVNYIIIHFYAFRKK